MAKTTGFYCTGCGTEHAKWAGQCGGCKEWNTIEEAPRAPAGRPAKRAASSWVASSERKVVALSSVDPVQQRRLSTGLAEFDRVLGGGVVPGGLVLLGGDPGVGKSTILTQVAGMLLDGGAKVLYVSGEESAEQVRLRADRLGGSSVRLPFLGDTSVEGILNHVAAMRPDVVVIDSIQTLATDDHDGEPGSVGQVKHCAARINRVAKESGVAVFMIGHVTKDGAVAGPRTLEHIVDTVVQFENVGGDAEHRAMRVTKNRFGSVDEMGVFRMTEAGLVPVANPSEIFLADRAADATGSAVVPILRGTRPLLVEVQGLVSVAAYGTPQRLVTGYSKKRLVLLTAVLEKRAGLQLGQCDAFLNVVGGIELLDPGMDLAVCAALASSHYNQALPPDAVFLGEVGLGGEVRRVAQLERRLNEAARLGFRTAYVATRGRPVTGPVGLQVVGVDHVAALIHQALGRSTRMGAAPAAVLEEARGAGAGRPAARGVTRPAGRTGRRTALALGGDGGAADTDG